MSTFCSSKWVAKLCRLSLQRHRRHYLPNRTMSRNLVTRAVMLGHQIRADQIPVPLPDIVRYLQAVEKGQ